MIEVLKSESFWLGVTAVITWAVNSSLTTRVAKLSPTSPWRRAIRALHGLLDAIDPKDAQ